MIDPNDAVMVRMYEALLEKHGDNYLGVGWTRGEGHAALRYQIMLEVIRPGSQVPVELLDFGCGASHLYEYIVARGISNINYSGLDISSKSLALSRGKHPNVTYYEADLMDSRVTVPTFDYILINGVFTYKGPVSYEVRLAYWQTLIQRVFAFARVGLAFNVMSKYVDWERDDLFHLPLEAMASLVTQKLSRHFTVRHDYAYEYTVYVYREPAPLPERSRLGI